jgi:AMP deaminase
LDPCDFSKVTKVDNHIHLAAAMTSKHLLTFIRNKVENHGDDVIPSKKYGNITLKDLFAKLGMTTFDFNVDALDTHRGETFQRFDVFNSKYDPFGFTELRFALATIPLWSRMQDLAMFPFPIPSFPISFV